MSSPDAILTAVRARLAAAYPAAADVSDRASPVAEARLPAYAVTVERAGTETLAMGGLRLAEDRVRVSYWQTGGANLRWQAAVAMAEIADAILAAPLQLGDLVDTLEIEDSAAQLEDAEKRVARTDVVALAGYAIGA